MKSTCDLLFHLPFCLFQTLKFFISSQSQTCQLRMYTLSTYSCTFTKFAMRMSNCELSFGMITSTNPFIIILRAWCLIGKKLNSMHFHCSVLQFLTIKNPFRGRYILNPFIKTYQIYFNLHIIYILCLGENGHLMSWLVKMGFLNDAQVTANHTFQFSGEDKARPIETINSDRIPPLTAFYDLYSHKNNLFLIDLSPSLQLLCIQKYTSMYAPKIILLSVCFIQSWTLLLVSPQQ